MGLKIERKCTHTPLLYTSNLISPFLISLLSYYSYIRVLLRASPIVIAIITSQKVQFFILTIHFLMSNSIDYLFYYLLALNYYFLFFYYIIANT
jgi:hypothetical protein